MRATSTRVPVLLLALSACAVMLSGCAGGSSTAEAAPRPAPETAPRPAHVAAAGARHEPIALDLDSLTLHGTLELPPASCDPGPHPVALIIAGSGPTDRDGNSAVLPGDNDGLRMLAEGLAADCIASVRYDKRGIGESAAPGLREQDLRFTTFSDDAAAWLRLLDADPRFDDLVVIGHSEGALLGTLAGRQVDVDGLVLVAGSGRPIAETLRQQLRSNLPAPMYEQADSILVELEHGRTVDNVPPLLSSLFRPSVQPYLISWLPLDPAAELAALDAPALVVQGTTDLQVTLEDAERLAAADDDVRLVVIEGMNHVLKPVEGTLQQQMASYSDPTLPLAEGLVEAVTSFIHEL